MRFDEINRKSTVPQARAEKMIERNEMKSARNRRRLHFHITLLLSFSLFLLISHFDNKKTGMTVATEFSKQLKIEVGEKNTQPTLVSTIKRDTSEKVTKTHQDLFFFSLKKET